MNNEMEVDVPQRIKGAIAGLFRAETVRILGEADTAIARVIAANKVAVAARESLMSAKRANAVYSGTEARITAELAWQECLAARRAFNAAVRALAVEKKVVAVLAAVGVGERL